MTIEEQTDILWNSIRKGVHDPEELREAISIDEAYRVQLGLLDRFEANGEKLVGWKVGLTAKVIQERVGYHEPVFGFLLASGHHASGGSFDFASLINPGFENELCLTLGRSLTGPNVTFAQAREAVSHIAPALEIVEKRCAAPFDMSLTMADNNQQKAFVTGDHQPLADFDLAEATVDVSVNGAFREQARGAEVQGSPIASVQWLANKLSQFGRTLEIGHLIMSGSFTQQYEVHAGDVVEAKFEPAGLVSVRFL
jgi:2-keto-4-pentenoate hydratase